MDMYFIIGLQEQKHPVTGQKTVGYRVTALSCASRDRIPVAMNDTLENKSFLVTEADLINLIHREGNVINNAEIINGRIEGLPASFDRFKLAVDKNNRNNVRRPLVLIGRIVNLAGDTVGYKVTDYNGNVRNFDVKTTALWIKQAQNFFVGSKPMPPFQNVIVHGKDKMGYPIIVPYKGRAIVDFSTNVGETKRASVVDNKKPMTSKDKQKVGKTVATFKPECKKLISQAQASGLNVRVLMNPKLSEEQLKALIKGMRRGVDVQKIANPDITPDYMDFCCWVERLGVDCGFVVNENLNNAQRSEVIIGIIDGVDVTRYAKRNKSAREMGQLRIRMRDSFWSKNSFQVTSDDTLVALDDSIVL